MEMYDVMFLSFVVLLFTVASTSPSSNDGIGGIAYFFCLTFSDVAQFILAYR